MIIRAVYLVPLYFLLALVQLAGIIMEHRELILFTKPALMSLLILFIFWNLWGKFRFYGVLMLLGFIFSLFGDVTLMLQNEPEFVSKPMFLFGLGFFLITHLFYLGGFLSFPSREKGFVRIFPKTVLPFLLFSGWMIYYLWPDLGEMRIPVCAYAITITAMAIGALNLSEKMDPDSFGYIFSGVLLFMFSDTIIALHRFKEGLIIPYPAVVIMTTYLLGQYYIAKGVIRANFLIPVNQQKSNV